MCGYLVRCECVNDVSWTCFCYQDQKGWTSLHYASRYGHAPVVRDLIVMYQLHPNTANKVCARAVLGHDRTDCARVVTTPYLSMFDILGTYYCT